ncbi:MAG TPA: homoserine dehydrogenase [Thermoplasmata archaeon]
MILRLAIIGFGNVGQEFARMLLSRRDWLLKSKGLDVEVLAIATKSKGCLVSKKALDLDRALTEMMNEGSLKSYGHEVTDLNPLKMIKDCDADIMVELSPLNIESGQPAIDHIRAAMESGMDVITANKGPVAFAYRNLRNTARSNGVRFRYEGTVMDGTPIFSLVERTLPGCEILGLKGILNSTSNFVLTEMSNGKSMEHAIELAQEGGFAETDPSLDIDGWDAAAKITALANVMMDADANPKLVDRIGVREVTVEEIGKASAQGKKIKLIAEATRESGGVKLEVKPRLIDSQNVFWTIDGTSSALTIRSDLMGDITISGGNPGLTQTAYAVFSDMLLIVESIRAGTL